MTWNVLLIRLRFWKLPPDIIKVLVSDIEGSFIRSWYFFNLLNSAISKSNTPRTSSIINTCGLSGSHEVSMSCKSFIGNIWYPSVYSFRAIWQAVSGLPDSETPTKVSYVCLWPDQESLERFELLQTDSHPLCNLIHLVRKEMKMKQILKMQTCGFI